MAVESLPAQPHHRWIKTSGRRCPGLVQLRHQRVELLLEHHVLKPGRTLPVNDWGACNDFKCTSS